MPSCLTLALGVHQRTQLILQDGEGRPSASRPAGARVEVQPPEVLSRDGPWGRWHQQGPQSCRSLSSEPGRVRPQQELSVTAKLELDVKTGDAGPAAAAQRLQQAGKPAEGEPAAAASGRSGRARSMMRWFSTAFLFAAYLGLVLPPHILSQGLSPDLETNELGWPARPGSCLSLTSPALRLQAYVIIPSLLRCESWRSNSGPHAGVGMSVAILGPTFQDLATNVNRNISSLSLIFVGRASGFLCGTMIGGVLYDHMNQFFLLGMSMVATTVSLYLIPFCKTAVVLIITMCVFGASAGAVDTGGNVLILALWGDKGAPHMQALHFSFALGAFLAPLLAKLAWGTTASAQNHTEFDPLMLNRSPGATSDSLFAVPENMNLLWAYASIGTYILVVSVFLFALFCKKRSRQKKSTVSAQGARRAKYHRALLCLLFLFFFFYVGAEVTYGSYLFSFATTHVGMEEAEAAGLNSAFWGTFAACRGLAIFCATLLKPGTMIVLSNIGSLVSSFFLVLFDKSPLCLWIASSVYGASMAATFPSGISWIEQYTSISARSAAFFVIGASLGDMAIPAVIGILQGYYPDLPVVLYTCFASAISTAVLFPVMYKLATLPLGHQRKEKREGKDHRTLSTSSRL